LLFNKKEGAKVYIIYVSRIIGKRQLNLILKFFYPVFCISEPKKSEKWEKVQLWMLKDC
jgi:hypothetical protein